MRKTSRSSCLAADLPNADMEADYGRPKDAMGRVLSNDYDTQRMGRMVSLPEGHSVAQLLTLNSGSRCHGTRMHLDEPQRGSKHPSEQVLMGHCARPGRAARKNVGLAGVAAPS